MKNQVVMLFALRHWGGQIFAERLRKVTVEVGLEVRVMKVALEALGAHAMIDIDIHDGYKRRIVNHYDLNDRGRRRLEELEAVGYSLELVDGLMALAIPSSPPSPAYLGLPEVHKKKQTASEPGPSSPKAYKEIPDHEVRNKNGRLVPIKLDDSRLPNFSGAQQAGLRRRCPGLKPAQAEPALRLLKGLEDGSGWLYVAGRPAHGELGRLMGTTSPQVIDAITLALSRSGLLVRKTVDEVGRGLATLRGVALPPYADQLHEARAKEKRRPRREPTDELETDEDEDDSLPLADSEAA